MSSPVSHFDTDVLIVGSGPTGATTATALATYGVRAHMVSRFNWLADTPRAHITNQRTMEVFRDLGLEDDCLRVATPWELMGDTLFSTSLAGEELVRMRTWGTGDERHGDYMQGSPCPLLDIPQPVVEPVIFKAAAERGATFSFNTEYLSHTQDEHGVTAHLQDRLTGREYTLRARYLVGADGAKSRIFEELGLPLEGHLARAGTVYVMFNADLSRYVQHRPSILHWIVTPDASFGEIGMGLLRAVRPWDKWIAGWGFDISKGEPDTSEPLLRERIRTLVGDPALDFEIERSSIWYVNQAYAPHYTKGRVFCGGDAVHRHPPSSGLGLNTCVQDAFNLAWKLAYVIKGHAGPELLETYSPERAPVGKQIVTRANQSRLDYAPLKAAFRVEGSENPVAAGIARFKDPGPAQGVEMNQRYASSAVIPDEQAGPETWQRDPELYLQPTTRPGAKIPHAWLIDRCGQRISTLDVTGQGQFSLVTGLSGQAWAQAAEQLGLPFLRTVVIGTPGLQDVYCNWQRLREIDEAGALLVRPDGVVAWRQMQPVHEVPAALAQLRQALAQVLAKPL